MRKRILRKLSAALVAIGLGSISVPAHAAIACPATILAEPKGNAMYLYFPTSSDSTFPTYDGEIGTSGSTSPLAAFDVANLASGIGTTAALRDRIHEIVTDDYCEFNVKVNKTTTAPAPSETRWQIVGLGTDSATSSSGGNLFGLAQSVDTNDADSQDYARVWADSFDNAYGGTGGALNGTNSTLERWATVIGETTAHESAHNYGAAHSHSAPRPSSAEDEVNNHIMATGSTGLTGEMRASRNRHFSDTEYEILGHNIGLNTKTLHNWDFVNPNNTSANGMRITILSTASSLSIGWSYNGSQTPWQNPTITNTGTTQNFQGTTYKVYNLDFTSAKSWNGPTAGVVEAGAQFHTGASFTGSDSVIVSRVQLLNSGTALPLAPRLPGYNAGTADLDSGDFDIQFFNTDPSAGDLLITNVVIRFLPRMVDINSMVDGAQPVDVSGTPVDVISSREVGRLSLKDRGELPLGKLTDKRNVDIVYQPKDCPAGSTGSGTPKPSDTTAPGDTDKGQVTYCLKGNGLSLFPATYTYIVATVVEPNVKHWDKTQGQFVTGPLESKLFYQVAGIVPDFDHNGTDDLIDIRSGKAPDENGNGVIDRVEPSANEKETTSDYKWVLAILVLLLLILLLILFLLRRRRS